MAYQVGIDLGTTSTVAAVCRPDGTAHVVPLEGSAGAVPSVVHLGADGDLLVGGAAERRALADPGRVVRELVRRVGDGTPLLVGREPVAAADLAARLLAQVADDVARREGGVASRVAVTHPGSWGPHRVSALRAALAEHGLGSAMLVPGPVAAARAAAAQVPPGASVGVHDLGGRFEGAVVRRGPRGFELAAAEELDGVGGADLDEVVFGHVRTALGPEWEALDPADPDVLAAVADLRRECTAAKEALSRDTEVLVPIALPGVRRQVRLGRAEFEEMIRPGVDETLEALRRALDAAGMSPADLAALVLVGGSAAIPLVPQLLGEAFGRDVTVAPDPAAAVAVGAALLARGPVAEPARRRGEGDLRAAVPVEGPARVAAIAPDARREQRPGVAGAGSASGPGTLPLVVGGAALATGRAASSAAEGPSSGTEVLPVARPPKQARPFTAPAGSASRSRRIALLGSAAALAVAVLGGVVAFGVGRIGAGAEAGAVTPASVVDGGAASTSAPAPPVPTAVPEPPARTGSASAGRRPRQAVPPPPVASSVTPSPPPPPPTQEPPAGEEQETGAPQPTADPVEGGDNGGAGGNDGAGGNGAGNGAGAGANGAGDGGAAGGGAVNGGAGSDGAGSDGAGGGSAQAADPAAAAAAPRDVAPGGAAPGGAAPGGAAPGGAAPEAAADQPAR